MAQEWACAYSTTGNPKVWPQTYWTQDTAHYMMSDHLIGAASWYDCDSPLFLAMGELEPSRQAYQPGAAAEVWVRTVDFLRRVNAPSARNG